MCFHTFSNVSSSSFIKSKNLKLFHPPKFQIVITGRSIHLSVHSCFGPHIYFLCTSSGTETSSVQMPLKRVTAVITRLVWSQCKHKKLFFHTCLVYMMLSKKRNGLKVGRRCSADTMRNKMPTVQLVMLSSQIFDINIWIQTQYIFFYLPRPCKWRNQATQRCKVPLWFPINSLTGTHPQRHWVCTCKSMHLLSTEQKHSNSKSWVCFEVLRHKKKKKARRDFFPLGVFFFHSHGCPLWFSIVAQPLWLTFEWSFSLQNCSTWLCKVLL